jgi:putative zinc finger protein
VNCVAVRDQLPELAVGVLSPREQVSLERHLEWCAGCRKEAAELGQAAATFAFALAPGPLPAGLEDRVVADVGRAVARPRTGRRTRTAIAAVLAAAIAVASLGWGAVMAGRAQRFAERAAQAEQAKSQALDQFQRVLDTLPFQARADETHLGQLAPTPAIQRGGGAVLQLVSPTRLDFVVVIVNGLPSDPSLAPYRVTLKDARGRVLQGGTIAKLDADGGGQAFRQFRNTDLTGFTTVLVRDASGRLVLKGTVDQTTGA